MTSPESPAAQRPTDPSLLAQDHAEDPVCSAKGCTAAAAWQLLWNNPKLHTPDRRKVWLACDEHRTSLGDFLTARGFLRSVEPHAAP